MVKIALNSHGTRALQKMIEFVSTREQTQTVINALNERVVELIQDLNGNHVIQKCLNRLSSEDAQVYPTSSCSRFLANASSSFSILLATIALQSELIVMVVAFCSAVSIMPLVSKKPSS